MVRDANGYTPLLKAASLGRLKMVKTLVEKASVDPRHIDPHGHTPREKALLYSKNDVVNYLQEAESKAKKGQLSLDRDHSRF